MRLSPYLLQLLAITSGGSSRGALALSSTPMVMMAAVANEPQQQQKPLGGTKGETQLSSEVAVAVAGHQFMSCEETYGLGWETCGDRVCRCPFRWLCLVGPWLVVFARGPRVGGKKTYSLLTFRCAR